MTALRTLPLIAVALLLTAPAIGAVREPLVQRGTPPPVRPAVPLDEDFRIGPEDVLNIVVLGHPDYTRTVPVRPDGRISLPLINDVQAAGLTAPELKAALTDRFKAFIKADVLEVSVIVSEVHSAKVAILGQVRTPMRFELRSRVTLLDAIAMAGGFTDFAKKDRVLIRRADGSNLVFNYERFVEHPESADNVRLRAGDIIIVP